MKKIFVVFILLCQIPAFAQQDPLFTQYMFNKLVVNPAYAGSRDQLTIDLLDRFQWVGIEGAPRTLTLGADLPLRNNKVGLGLYIYRDELGPTVDQGLMGTYAYHIKTLKGRFSFGLQVGVKYFDFDWNAIRTQHPDYMYLPQDVQNFSMDANIGMYYQTKRFYAGLSSKQLLQNEYGLNTYEGKTTYSRLLRHFYGMTGIAVPLEQKIVFRPSVLLKYVKGAPLQADLNASFVFNNLFWAGASFRTEKAVALLAEFRITPFMRLGYSFDLYLNELQVYNKGSHELRLGFDLHTDHTRMMTPRFFY